MVEEPFVYAIKIRHWKMVGRALKFVTKLTDKKFKGYS